MEDKQRYIPLKNYFITIIMFIAIILITLYIFKWIEVKQNEKISKSYLIENNLVTNKINTLDELNDFIKESPSQLIIYISYTKDNKIYNIEKGFKKLFTKYDLQDIFYIFDISDIKENNKNYIKYLNESLDINVNGYPVIIYYEDGSIVSYKKISSYKDAEKLFKKYDIEKK